MAKGINIPIVTDTSKVIKGTKDVEDALEKVGDALDNLDDAGKDAGDSLGDNLKDGATKASKATGDLSDDAKRDLKKVQDDAKDTGAKIDSELTDGTKEAADAGDKMESKFSDALKKVKAKAKDAGDDSGTSLKKGMDEGSKASEEFKSEATQNLSETVSSFRGDAEDIVQVIQDTFGGIVGGLGPMGMVAGAAMAAGIGVGVQMLQNAAEEAEEARERVADLAQAIVDAGGDITAVDIAGKIREWGYEAADVKSWFEPWQDRTITNLEDIRDKAEQVGLSFSDMAAGLAGGDLEQGEANLDAINELLEREQQTLADLTEEELTASPERVRAIGEEMEAHQEKVRTLEDLKGQQEKANSETELAIELANLETTATEDNTEALEAKRDALAELRGETKDAMEAEEDYYASVEAATAALEENGGTMDASTEAGRTNRKAVRDQVEAINDYIDSLINNGESLDTVKAKQSQMRDQLIETMKQHGISETAAADYIDQLLATPDEISTSVQLNTGAAQSKLDAFVNQRRTIAVNVQTNDFTNRVMGKRDGGPVRAASGRYITGAGTDNSDSIPALLSNGEFVLDAQATKQLGIGNLQALNEGITPASAASTVSAQVPEAAMYQMAQIIAEKVAAATYRATYDGTAQLRKRDAKEALSGSITGYRSASSGA